MPLVCHWYATGMRLATKADLLHLLNWLKKAGLAQPRPASRGLVQPHPASPSLAKPRPALPSLAQPRPASSRLVSPHSASHSLDQLRPASPNLAKPSPSPRRAHQPPDVTKVSQRRPEAPAATSALPPQQQETQTRSGGRVWKRAPLLRQTPTGATTGLPGSSAVSLGAPTELQKQGRWTRSRRNLCRSLGRR